MSIEAKKGESIPNVPTDFLKIWTDTWAPEQWGMLEAAKALDPDQRKEYAGILRLAVENFNDLIPYHELHNIKFTLVCYELPEGAMDELLKLAPSEMPKK